MQYRTTKGITDLILPPHFRSIIAAVTQDNIINILNLLNLREVSRPLLELTEKANLPTLNSYAQLKKECKKDITILVQCPYGTINITRVESN